MRQAVKNSADPRQVAKASKQDQKEERLREEAARAVMRTEEGRYFINVLLDRFEQGDSEIYGVGMTQMDLAYVSASVDFGKYLRAWCMASDKELYLQMMSEKVYSEKG